VVSVPMAILVGSVGCGGGVSSDGISDVVVVLVVFSCFIFLMLADGCSDVLVVGVGCGGGGGDSSDGFSDVVVVLVVFYCCWTMAAPM
jgi:hypothetical protein